MRHHDERGASMSLATAVLIPGLIVGIGLVADGSRKTNAAREASAVAASAARAGTNAYASQAIGGSGNPSVARAAAQRYLAASGVPGSVSISGATVTVHTRITVTTNFLSLIGITTLTAQGQSTARLQEVPA